MGGFFSLFQQDVDVSDVFVDFKSAQPSENEKALCEQVDLLLNRGSELVKHVEGYTDCSAVIRKALSNPTPENEEEAFKIVKTNANLINDFYQHSKSMEVVFPKLLKALSADDEKRSVQDKQAVAKKTAELLDFVLKFDELKMLRPGMQNDFSFYRRSLGRHAADPDLIVKDDEASFISLFIAQPIPMMTVLISSTSELLNQDAQSSTTIPRVLATMANVCLHLVKTKTFPDDADTNRLCVRTMVSSIVLFDHISAEGAFVKRSGINIKSAVSILTSDYKDQKCLINALKFSTLHFSDDSTPSYITSMLERED